MKTPLALHNLAHQWQKTLVSVAGVAFALLLVFMQLGFMGAVSNTATNVLESLKFDVLLRSRDYIHLYEAGQLERKWLDVAQSTPGVVSAKPLWITIHNWRKLPTDQQEAAEDFESQYLPIAVMAFELNECVFSLEDIHSQLELLSSGQSLLLDQSTQREFGPRNGFRFEAPDDIGRTTEIGGQEFAIGGFFRLGTGLAANGAAILSRKGFARISPWDVGRYTTLGLIELDPDVTTTDIAVEQLKKRLQVDAASESGLVEVVSRAEGLALETNHWLWATPIGLIFQMGVALALMVGAAIVYMVLSTDVANRLPEYATLLAMGYSRTYLATVVMTQALALSLLGYVTAVAAAYGLFNLTSWASQIPITMTFSIIYYVAVLGVFMCCCSGMLALRKLWQAEPASLF